MPKSARGLQQKRKGPKREQRSVDARDRSLQARKEAKAQGITADDERRLNSEASAEALERRTIKKEKRQKRKMAKGAVRSAAEEKAHVDTMLRAQSLAEQETRDRQRAATAAAAARAKQQ